METVIKFRIIENGKNLGETQGVFVNDPNDIYEEELILDQYKQLKLKYPNSEIMVICETKHWETYTPMSKLLAEDIYQLIKNADKIVKNGIIKNF